MTKRGRPRKERYARLMGGFWRNHKIRRLSLEARGLLATAWSYSSDQNTDGAIPVELLQAWGGRRYPKLMAELTRGTDNDGDRPLFVLAEGEIDAHANGWGDVNISVEAWEAKLESDRKRKPGKGDFPTGKGTGKSPDFPTGNDPTFQGHALDDDEDEESLRETDPPTPVTPEPISEPVPPQPRAKPKPEIAEVFEYWRSTLGKSAAAKLDPKRRKRIEWALKAYGLDAVKRCIDGYATSAWHRGTDPRSERAYDDLELWLRDAKHVEAGLDMAKGDGGRRARGPLAPAAVDAAAAEESMRRAEDLFGPIREAANG